MLTLEIRWDISQPGPCGDRDFFGSVLSAWISFAQIKHPIFGVFLNVTLLLLLWSYSSKGWFSLELPQYTFLKQIAFLGVWGMQEDGFGISPWQLLHLCAHCWDQSEKGLVGHKWSVLGYLSLPSCGLHQGQSCWKHFPGVCGGITSEKGLFGANLQFLPLISVRVKHKNPAGTPCYY